MKKILCFVLVLCLALAPMAVLAEENGYENGYAYENGTDDAADEDASDVTVDEASDEVSEEASEEPTEEASEEAANDAAEENGYQAIEPISGELELEATAAAGQTWTFGLGGEASQEQGLNGWYFMYSPEHDLEGAFPSEINYAELSVEGAVSGWAAWDWSGREYWYPVSVELLEEAADWWIIDDVNGNVFPSYTGVTAIVAWRAPFAGEFTVAGSVVAGVNPDHFEHERDAEVDGVFVSIFHNEDSLFGQNFPYEQETYDFDFLLVLEAGDTIYFIVDPNALFGSDATTWGITITEMVEEAEAVEAEEVAEEVAGEPAEVVEIEVPVATETEPAEEVEAPAVSPLADVPVRVVDGVDFVGFRAAANAYGVFDLTWDGATQTVGFPQNPALAFTVAEANGFFDAETSRVYVPVTFAVDFFEVLW